MKPRINQDWMRWIMACLLVLGICCGVIAPIHAAPSQPVITAYRSPTCGCCHEWVDHLKAAGFEVKDIVTDEMAQVKRMTQVPEPLISCHTAVVEGYVIEGHVPAEAIQQVIEDTPQISGIAVPGMPIGSPGMEMGNLHQPFAVISFDRNGQTEVLQLYPAIR